jgi:hypothetical protein
MTKEEFAMQLYTKGDNSTQIATVSGGVVTVNNFSRTLSDSTFDEALRFYIDEIKISSLPLMEKALLIDEAPRRIRRIKNKRLICDKAYDKLELPSRLGENLSTTDCDKVHLILDEAEKVSDESIQDIWANILKRTVEDGGISKRLINILSNLNKDEAIIFEELCKYLVIIRTEEMIEDISLCPLATAFFLGNGNNYGFKINGLKRGDISRLVNAGLVQIQNTNYEYWAGQKTIAIDYLRQRVYLNPLNSEWVRCGHFRLTFEGEELYNTIEHTSWDFDENYYNFIKNELEKQWIIDREHECSITRILNYPVVY